MNAIDLALDLVAKREAPPPTADCFEKAMAQAFVQVF